MNYKNCKHYTEITRVLSENLSLDDVEFELEDNLGCECKLDGDSVCELWCTLAFAHDMAPQLGIEHAEKTIANLDNRVKEIATLLVSNASTKVKNINNMEEKLPEKEIDNEWFTTLPIEKQKLLEQLAELGDVTYIQSNLSRHELIVKAISEMDIEQLEKLVENYLNDENKEEFMLNINSQFNIFKANNDTHLIAHSGICGSSSCNNYRSRGYSFTGNVSNNFYNLVFEEENGVCNDICKCFVFKINDPVIQEAREEAKRKAIDYKEDTDDDLDDLPF